MTSPDTHYRWLIEHGHAHLTELRLISTRPLKVDWSNTRLADWQQRLLEEQLHYQQRASGRFPDPSKWLWTDRSLQQASDWQSAKTKAGLFPSSSCVVDACCGAGADLVALAQDHSVVAMDRDRTMLELARANNRAHGGQAEYVQAELPAALGQLREVCLHADPDRRRGQERETRTTHAEAFSPPLADIMQLGDRARACIVKLAPATDLDLPPDTDWRRAWLGVGRECPQQLLMRGQLNWQIPAGQRGALLVDHPQLSYSASERSSCDVTDEPEQYIYEPHAALYASQLAAAWADEHNLLALPHAGSYFTGSELAPTPWSQAFETIAHMSWDEKRVRKWLRANSAGLVEVKTRNVPLDANALQRTLNQAGCQANSPPITCLLYRIGKSIRVAMARRK